MMPWHLADTCIASLMDRCSFGKVWDAWEQRFHEAFGMDALVRQSLMLSLVCFHLNNEVYKMLWLREELKLLGINEVSKLILNLDNQLNNIETVETMVGECRFKGHRCFLSGSEVALHNREHIFFNFI